MSSRWNLLPLITLQKKASAEEINQKKKTEVKVSIESNLHPYVSHATKVPGIPAGLG